MSDTHTVLYDPHGLIEAELPLDRAPYEALVTAVLAWKNPDLEPRDYEQIALQLIGHARAVAADVRRHATALPKNNGRGALAEVLLRVAAAGALTKAVDRGGHVAVGAADRVVEGEGEVQGEFGVHLACGADVGAPGEQLLGEGEFVLSKLGIREGENEGALGLAGGAFAGNAALVGFVACGGVRGCSVVHGAVGPPVRHQQVSHGGCGPLVAR